MIALVDRLRVASRSSDLEATSTGSVFARGLGEDFNRLHPMTQWRFGQRSGDAPQRGVGTLDIRVAFWARPLLHLWASQAIAVTRSGANIPFTIANVPFVDEHGRESVTVSRRFFTAAEPEHFDATMIAADRRGLVDDFLGHKQNVLARLVPSVDPVTGGIRFRSTELRWVRRNGRSARMPTILAGTAHVHEWWDGERFRIEVRVVHRLLGEVFGYSGAFDVVEVDRSDVRVCDAVPTQRRVPRPTAAANATGKTLL